MDSNLIADIIGAIVMIWGAITLVGAAGQYMIIRKADFKEASFFPVFGAVIGIVLLLGGYYITTLG